MSEDYQAEFASLMEGQGEPAAETQDTAQTPEEMIELALGEQTHKVPLSTEIPFKHNGTIQKVPFSKLLNQYRQADHLDSKMNEYKTLKEQMEQERGDMEQYKSMRQKYEEIQRWSEENPDQWERLHSLWQQREQALQEGGEQNAMVSEINALRGQLKEFQEFKSSIEKEREARQTQEDIDLVKSQIEEFAKEFPDIPLDEKDEEGLTVKDRVIAFGVQNGIPDFESAALKYLKPRLLDTISARARNETVKGLKSDRQQGIVSRSSTPAPGQGNQTQPDPRKMSYGELNEAAKAEFEQLLNDQ